MLLHYNGEHRQLFNYVLLLSTNTIIINFSTFSRLKHFNLLMKDNCNSVILYIVLCTLYKTSEIVWCMITSQRINTQILQDTILRMREVLMITISKQLVTLFYWGRSGGDVCASWHGSSITSLRPVSPLLMFSFRRNMISEMHVRHGFPLRRRRSMHG